MQALLWLKQSVIGLSLRRPGFANGSVYVRFVVHWDSFFFGFSLSVVFHFGSPYSYSYIIWWTNNRPAWGRSSETVSFYQRDHHQAIQDTTAYVWKENLLHVLSCKQAKRGNTINLSQILYKRTKVATIT